MNRPTPRPPAPENNSSTLAIVLAVLAVVGFFVIAGVGATVFVMLTLLPTADAVRSANQNGDATTKVNTESLESKKQASTANLKRIGLALLNYEATHKRLPAQCGINHQQKPTCSWRVSILPYVDQAELFQRFKMEEPWDAAINQSLLVEMPAVYRSPLAPASQPAGHTNLFAIRDPKSLMPGPAVYVNFASVSDGLANTVVAIELPEHSAPWLETEGLTVAEAIKAIRASPNPSEIQLLMMNGNVVQVGNLSDEQLSYMMLRDDGHFVVF